jgi:hypothetical protein
MLAVTFGSICETGLSGLHIQILASFCQCMFSELDVAGCSRDELLKATKSFLDMCISVGAAHNY